MGTHAIAFLTEIGAATTAHPSGTLLAHLRGTESAPVPGRDRRSRMRDKTRSDLSELPHDELARLIRTLEEEMKEASADLRFEYAARLRDEIHDLKRELRELV